MEEQQQLEKNNRKTDQISGTNKLYPPININVLPSHPPGLDATASNVVADPSGSKKTCPLKIPGYRDVTVKEYGE
jgi:hypothetical protein